MANNQQNNQETNKENNQENNRKNNGTDKGNKKDSKTMLTDLYQLTMLAAYQDSGKQDDLATFDLFIRSLPKDWGYFIAAGIEDAVDYATNIKFEDDDLEYLKAQGFKQPFLDYLKDFKFQGDIYAVEEGTVVFPNEPILRVTAKRSEAQFLETALLNIINFQTLIASKASRVVNAAASAPYPAGVIDFGLRRAQEEDAGMKGARAAYIAGAIGTSNVKAGKEYCIPIKGTHAHSFVMSFPSEIEAFRAYVNTFPDNGTLLIDTYDTEQGARNAARVAKELEAKGHKLGAVRLDSGDLADLSKKVRMIFDDQGLQYVRITASNDLNEYKIAQLKEADAPITGYGVGTEMITAKPIAAISGVYKLVEDNAGPKIKLSAEKKSVPGEKNIYRLKGHDGKYLRDVLALRSESEYEALAAPLLTPVVKAGERAVERRNADWVREHVNFNVIYLPAHLKELKVTRQYPIELSTKLAEVTDSLAEKYGKLEQHGK